MPFVVAVTVAARSTGRYDWLHWSPRLAAGAIVTMLACAGSARLLADRNIRWAWVGAGSLVSAAGVWAAVPETGPALLVGGCLTGLIAAALLTGSSWTPAAGVGVATILGWAALSGAVGRPWAAIGGALCAGIAPWFALGPIFPVSSRSRSPGPWLLAAHTVLVLFAARWVGVVRHAGWHRVAIMAAGGLAVAAVTRRKA